MAQLSGFSQWVRLFATSRREGALLRLTARCPSSPELNRTLGSELVRKGLALCGTTVAITVALACFYGVSRDGLIASVSISIMLVMPGIAWMLRDYSIEQSQRRLLLMFLLVVPAAVAVLPALVATIGLDIAIGAWAWVLLAVSSNVLGAVLAVGRWKRMIAAPPALPAYRTS